MSRQLVFVTIDLKKLNLVTMMELDELLNEYKIPRDGIEQRCYDGVYSLSFYRRKVKEGQMFDEHVEREYPADGIMMMYRRVIDV